MDQTGGSVVTSLYWEPNSSKKTAKILLKLKPVKSSGVHYNFYSQLHGITAIMIIQALAHWGTFIEWSVYDFMNSKWTFNSWDKQFFVTLNTYTLHARNEAFSLLLVPFL